MPFASIRKKRIYDRELYKDKYSTDAKFAEAERERQRKLYEANREKIIARVMARRAALKAAKLATAAKPAKAKTKPEAEREPKLNVTNREKILARVADRRAAVKAAKLAAAKAAAAKSAKTQKLAKAAR